MLLLILCLGLWMGHEVNSARRQQRAVAAIKAYGGYVHYDYELVKGSVVPGRKPWVPRWLRSRLGDDYFVTVTQVNLVYEVGGASQGLTKRNDPSVLSALRDLPWVKWLFLHERQVTDDSLALLKGLKGLEELSLVRAEQLTDAGLAHIAELKSLKSLTIEAGENTKLTDAGLVNFSGLHRLQVLYLWPGSAITDAGLAHIAGLTELNELTIFNGTFTDTGIGYLSRLVKLKELHLPFSAYHFTEGGMARLQRLTNLVVLDLQGPGLPARGLAHLASLPNLRQLWLAQASPLFHHESGIRDAVERLMRANPNLTVR